MFCTFVFWDLSADTINMSYKKDINKLNDMTQELFLEQAIFAIRTGNNVLDILECKEHSFKEKEVLIQKALKLYEESKYKYLQSKSIHL